MTHNLLISLYSNEEIITGSIERYDNQYILLNTIDEERCVYDVKSFIDNSMIDMIVVDSIDERNLKLLMENA